MATVTPTMPDSASGDGSIKVYQWALTSANADGSPLPFPEWADITWHFFGTWGGATAKVQGSADGSTFYATGLSNAAGGAEGTASADKIFTTIERPMYVRPILTTVGAGATITVTAVCRRTSSMRN